MPPTGDAQKQAFRDLWAQASQPVEDQLRDLLPRIGLPDETADGLTRQVGVETRYRFLAAAAPPADLDGFLGLVCEVADGVIRREIENHVATLGLALRDQFRDRSSIVLLATVGVIERLRDQRFTHRTDAQTAAYIRLRVRRAILDAVRATNRHPTVPLDSAEQGAAEPRDYVGDSPSRGAILNEEIERLRQAIAELPTTHRRVMEADLEHPDLTSEGIATLLGTTAQTVRQRRSEAIRMLRDRLAPVESTAGGS